MARDRHQETGPPPGVHDLMSEPPPTGWQNPQPFTATGFWRVRVSLPNNPEPGAPDHVVAARDEIEAEARAYQQLGIRSVDKSVNQVEIMPVSELEFLTAQAKTAIEDTRIYDGKRLVSGSCQMGVDLRQKRLLLTVDGMPLAREAPEYGKLTWAPPGYKLSRDYWVDEFGTLHDKKPENERR